MSGSDPAVSIHLLRHGEVRSHRGDVPITPEAVEHAEKVGRRFVGDVSGVAMLLCGDTRRARETAQHLARGIEQAGGEVDGPTVSHALRNPDLYLGGYRVNIVGSSEALAAQVPGLEPEDVAGLEFFPRLIAEPDRVGWWLRHPDPPGEGAATVADRISAFSRSLVNPFREDRRVVVAVTHSPLVRAVALAALGHDIGEPEWISGLTIDVDLSGRLTISPFPAGA